MIFFARNLSEFPFSPLYPEIRLALVRRMQPLVAAFRTRSQWGEQLPDRLDLIKNPDMNSRREKGRSASRRPRWVSNSRHQPE